MEATPVQTLKNLALALVNATLILIALCLFLLWQIGNTAERVAGSFAENLELLGPLRAEVAGLRDDLSGLRGDLAEIQAVPGQGMDAVEAQLDAVGARLDGVQARVNSLSEAPERLMTAAIDRSADRLAGGLEGLLSCARPEIDPEPTAPQN